MVIGKFTTSETGQIEGFVQTLCSEMGIIFHPEASGVDYRIMTDNGCEVGAGWKKISKDGKSYVSCKLDSPFLTEPVNCSLFVNKDGSFNLVWNRPKAD